MSKKRNKRNTKSFRKTIKKRTQTMVSPKKKSDMEFKNRMVDFQSIKTPTTVEEFRDNLLKYYFSIGRSVYESRLGYINVDEINSMDDIRDMMYEKCEKSSFNLTPLVVQTTDWKDFVYENLTLSYDFNRFCMKWWMESENNIIYERNLKTEKSPMDGFQYVTKKYGDGNFLWKEYFKDGKDNFYEFYIKTLGKFSGYSTHRDFTNGIKDEFRIDDYISENYTLQKVS